MQERRAPLLPGLPMFLIYIGLTVLSFTLVARSFGGDGGLRGLGRPGLLVWGVVVLILSWIYATGFVIVAPNQSRVVTFFGRYLGTIRRNGWSWTIPLADKKKVSLRIRNFESGTLKVNDAVGNPVEISAIVVWRVTETAKAVFDVEDYENFVQVQTETAVRHVASQYPYDSYEEGQASLRANADDVAETMNTELRAQLDIAGVEVMRTQLRRLAYAPEIATDMLRRQQAEAVVAARFRIVEGAVLMVEDALQRLASHHIVEMDDDRKAAMVSNLLVVLCSEHHAQPVVNTGTLYQ